jgi:hypothetical protein
LSYSWDDTIADILTKALPRGDQFLYFRDYLLGIKTIRKN